MSEFSNHNPIQEGVMHGPHRTESDNPYETIDVQNAMIAEAHDQQLITTGAQDQLRQGTYNAENDLHQDIDARNYAALTDAAREKLESIDDAADAYSNQINDETMNTGGRKVRV